MSQTNKGHLMLTLNPNILKRIPTTYDALKAFRKNIKVFLYFRAENNEEGDYIYHLFNNKFEFYKNIELLNQRFKDIKGYHSFYTNHEKYHIEVKEDKNKQLTLPL